MRECYIRDDYHVGNHSRPTPRFKLTLFFLIFGHLILNVLFFVVINVSYCVAS